MTSSVIRKLLICKNVSDQFSNPWGLFSTMPSVMKVSKFAQFHLKTTFPPH